MHVGTAPKEFDSVWSCQFRAAQLSHRPVATNGTCRAARSRNAAGDGVQAAKRHTYEATTTALRDGARAGRACVCWLTGTHGGAGRTPHGG